MKLLGLIVVTIIFGCVGVIKLSHRTKKNNKNFSDYRDKMEKKFVILLVIVVSISYILIRIFD